MPLAAGTRLGAYEIQAALGAGGMGEVYRARDIKLDREVAIKVLPDAFTADLERVARFEREAKTLATLNHSHIAQIYGVEEHNGTRALVMELVEGDTLAHRLRTGAIPLDEAVPLARQIAEALEAAHDRGIIHRDLKPANIAVRSDGTVKVLDFGLAKALEPPSGIPAIAAGNRLADSPTITSPVMTRAGVILGTATYMSPEQAKGKSVDHRTDIWAFGCVVYEMLTGRPPFAGETVTEVLARIIEREPDWALLRPQTPTTLRRVLQRCLQKNPAKRYRHIGDVILDLELAPDPLNRDALRIATQSRWVMIAGWLVAAVLAVLAGLFWMRSETATAARVTTFELTAPAGHEFSMVQVAPFPAVSPDSTRVIFLAAREGHDPSLWIRTFADATPIELPNTERAQLPFWSPDSRSIAFFRAGRLYRLDTASGSPQLICELPASSGEGGAWGRDGSMLIGSVLGGIYRVAADGGTPEIVTSPAGDEQSHHWPVWLPGEDRFLYRTDKGSIFSASLDGADRQKILDANSRAEYVDPGLLLYLRGNALMAQRFDVTRGAVQGDPTVLVESVRAGISGRAAFSAAPHAMVSRPTTFDVAFTWDVYDELGKPIQSLPFKTLRSFALSPDGSQVAVHTHDSGAGGGEFSLIQLEGGAVTRLNRAPLHDDFPVWSPDGTRLAITDFTAVSIIRADGTGERDVLLRDATAHPTDWVPGRDWIIYHTDSSETDNDIWALPLAGDRKPRVLIKTRAAERNGVVSPNGEWLAFTSNESGRIDVYVQKFPEGGRKLRISDAGGSHARWDPQGRFLYYWSPEDRVMRVPVNLRGPSLRPGTATPVLTLTNTGSQFGLAMDRSPYIVGPKGVGFIGAQGQGVAHDPRLTVVMSWQQLLNRRGGGS